MHPVGFIFALEFGGFFLVTLSTEYSHLPSAFEILVILKSSLELVHGSLLSWLRSWTFLLSRLRTIISIIEQKIEV